jgi:hypothetical protein
MGLLFPFFKLLSLFVLLIPSLPTDIEEGQGWERPIPNLNPDIHSLIFQQMEVDYTLGEAEKGMPGLQISPVPIIRMFGSTKEGNRF